MIFAPLQGKLLYLPYFNENYLRQYAIGQHLLNDTVTGVEM